MFRERPVGRGHDHHGAVSAVEAGTGHLAHGLRPLGRRPARGTAGSKDERLCGTS